MIPKCFRGIIKSVVQLDKFELTMNDMFPDLQVVQCTDIASESIYMVPPHLRLGC